MEFQTNKITLNVTPFPLLSDGAWITSTVCYTADRVDWICEAAACEREHHIECHPSRCRESGNRIGRNHDTTTTNNNNTNKHLHTNNDISNTKLHGYVGASARVAPLGRCCNVS